MMRVLLRIQKMYTAFFIILFNKGHLSKKNPTNKVMDKDHANRALCPENVTLPHPHA
jgi:hypothetical protein